jgi:hypothetical protein
VRRPSSPATDMLHGALVTGRRVAVLYVGADALAHYREGQLAAIEGSRFVLAYQDSAGLARQARFDLADPDDVLAVEPVS